MGIIMDGGKLVIISAPTASGKSTIVAELIKQLASSVRLVTTTSRPPREGEEDGRDYHFVSREEFIERRGKGEFFEWVEYSGNLYGSSRVVAGNLRREYDYVFAVLEVRGAKLVKEVFPDAIKIFVRPDSMEVLRKRLLERGSLPDEVEARLERAKEEMIDIGEFEHIVTNYDGRLGDTVQEILDIVAPSATSQAD